jgi:hypothetical protein
MPLTKLIALAGLACSWSAAALIAKFTDVKGLFINSKPVPDKTTPTRPVVGNDAMATTTNPAVLVLPKGGRALLEAENTIRLLERNGDFTLEIVGGELCLLMHDKSHIQMFTSGAELPITPHSRALSLSGLPSRRQP